METGHRNDLIVEGKVIVELKCVEAILPIHEAQLFIYMRLSQMCVGLIINFYATAMNDGIVRRVL